MYCNKSSSGNILGRGMREGDQTTLISNFTQLAVPLCRIEVHAQNKAPRRNDLSLKGSLFLFVFL